MLEGADDDLVAGFDQVFQTVGNQVQRFGRATGEYDFGRAGGIQPLGDLDTGVFVGTGGAFGRLVLGTVHIGRTAGVVTAEGVDQRLRLCAVAALSR